MSSLTVNQMILLLAVARGTVDNELYCGTRTNDLKVLGRHGLIVRRVTPTGTHDVTPRGQRLVDELRNITGAFVANDGMLNRRQLQELSIQVDAGDLRECVGSALTGLAGFANLVHGNFQVEPDEGKGLRLSDVENGKARINGGSVFLVAEANVTLAAPIEGSGAEFGPIKFETIDLTVHNTEEQATDVAVDRAKAQVGSRHVVLKAVAMHEVAVPIKSTRL
jgi:hypothetical protein